MTVTDGSGNTATCNQTLVVVNNTAETCNMLDDNCNGTTDEGVTTTYYQNNDGDGFGNSAVTLQACSVPAGYTTTGGDCNDNNNQIYPGKAEACNSLDDNCNGQIDEGILLDAAACAPLIPTGMAMSNITATSAKSSWTALSCVTGYRVQYRKVTGTTVWTFVNVNVPTTNVTISGLTPCSPYYARVRSVCGSNTSTLGPNVTFTTTCASMGAASNDPQAITSTDTKATPVMGTLNVFPSPTRGNATLDLRDASNGPATVRIMDAFGKQFFAWNTNITNGELRESFDLGDVPTGVYFIRVQQGDNSITKAIIKE